jgi:hypothetical protein
VEALADCLESMRRGEADMDTCLDRYPEHRGQLQALLEVASLIRPLPEDVVPSPNFRDQARQRIVRQGRENSGVDLTLDPNAGPA